MSTVQRSETLWFEDGNLILEADATRFRVYQGVLVKHSSVFRDMLSVPQPSEQDFFEGLPVVQLYDSSADVTYFLSALYDTSANPLETNFEAISGVLKLSAKYDIPHLRLRAKSYLTAIYPTTLSAWDQREIPLSFSPLAVLDLAHSMDIPEILPAVFLDCSTQSTEALLDSIASSSTPTLTPSLNDLRTCFDARQALLEATITRIYGFLRDFDCESCPPKRNCPLARLRWMISHTAFANHGWAHLEIKVDWIKYEYAVCKFCLLQAQEGYNSARKKLWNELPSFFNLPPWDQLKSQAE